MIFAGTLLLAEERRRVDLVEGWLRTEGEKIVAVGFGQPPGPVDFGGADCIISPGFIDTHLHLPQFAALGRDGLDLFSWLEQIIFPAESQWEDADLAAAATSSALDQLLAHGTTSFCGYATVHAAATARAMQMIEQRRMRALVGQVLMDSHAPAELIRPAGQLLAEAAELLANYPPGPGRSRVEFAVSPRFAVACSEELLVGAGDLARRTAVPVQTHLAETSDECRLVCERFDAETYTQVYDRAGLLTPRTLLGHGIHLSPAERQRLSKRGSAVVHCPTANLFLRAGSMSWETMRRDGVNLGLGSDIGAGAARSMVRVGQAMIDTARFLSIQTEGLAVPKAAEVFWQITAGNAAIAGWPTAGRIAMGADADLLVLRPDLPWNEAPDPLSLLLFAWDDRWLLQTIVAGQPAWTRA